MSLPMKSVAPVLFVIAWVAFGTQGWADEPPYSKERGRMVEDILALWSITERELEGRAPDER